MSKVRECKKIWFLVMLFMSIIFMGKSVMADDSVEVTVTVDKDNYYSNGNYMSNISKLNGVSYDETKRELTLNNFTGDRISIFVKDSSVKKFTLRILGNNTLSKKISGNSTLIFVNRDYRFDGQLDFSIVGDGSLTLDNVTMNNIYQMSENGWNDQSGGFPNLNNTGTLNILNSNFEIRHSFMMDLL